MAILVPNMNKTDYIGFARILFTDISGISLTFCNSACHPDIHDAQTIAAITADQVSYTETGQETALPSQYLLIFLSSLKNTE